MPNDNDPVGLQCLFPVATRAADRQQVNQADMLAKIGQQSFQTGNGLDTALSLSPLEDMRTVVAAIDRLAERTVGNRFGPASQPSL